MSKREKIFSITLVVINAFAILFMLFAGVKYSIRYIDNDMAKLFVHAVEMSKNGSFFIEGWKVITTMELDCSLFFAVPIYSVVKDIYVAFAISNCLFAAIYIWVLITLFKGEKLYIPLLISAVIFIPYSLGQLDYYNMMFFNGGQYTIKVLLPLMLLSIYRFKEFKKSNIPFYLIFILFTFITALSSGIYVAACGFAPVIVYELIVCIFEKRGDSTKKITYPILITIITMMVYLIALAVGKIINVGALGDTMTLCQVSSLPENIEANFWGIFDILGAVARVNVPVMSVTGIMTLLKMLLVAIMIITCIVVAIREFKTSKREEKSPTLSAALIIMFVWNILILFISDTRYGLGFSCYRYQLIGLIPLICMCLYEWCKKVWSLGEKTQAYMFAISALAVLIIMGYSDVSLLRGGAEYNDVSSICKFANDNDVEKVYYLCTSEPAELSRLIDYKSDIKYLSVDGYGNTYVYDYYLSYDLAPADFNNSILVVPGLDDKPDMEFMNMRFEDVIEIGAFTIMRAN